MKARTLITMTGAILTLSASVAQASVQRATPAKHTIATAHKIVAKKSVTTQPLYIYVAPSSLPASVDTTPAYDGSMICPDGNTLDEDCGYCN